MVTWILTGSPENFAATRAHGFTVVGLKERRRSLAEQIEPGDRIIFSRGLRPLTRFATTPGYGAFGAAVRVTGELFESRQTVWPGKPGKADAYPWRFATEPEVVLDEADWVPADTVREHLEHVTKWPAEHWKLAFQGQIRRVSEADGELLAGRLHAAAGTAAQPG